jgi:integrase
MGLYKRKLSPFWWMNLKIGSKRIMESTGTINKKKAQEILSIRHAELLSGKATATVLSEPQELKATKESKEIKIYTFNELAEEYLNWCKGRQASYNVKKYIIPKEFEKRFKGMPLNLFNSNLIEKLQTECMTKNYKPAYTNKIITILKHMFTKALDWEMITEETLKKVRKVKLLKGEIKRLRYLSDEEGERFIFNCESYLKPIVICALNTGMRKSEIFGLTWDRIDLKNRIILLDKTKNGERREIPINDTLHRILSGLVRRLDCKYVFYNPKTLKPFDNVKRSFGTALRKSHILDFHFHDMRHTFASRLVMAGVDLITVKELLGHKDIKMTLRYSHLSQAHVRQAISVLDKKCDSCVTVGEDGEFANRANPLFYW